VSNERLLRRLFAALVALVVSALVLAGPLTRPAAAATPVASADAGFLSLLNTLRGTLGLPTLAVDPQLSSVAQAWSVKMAGTGTLAHNPDLTSQVGPRTKVGENVAFGYGYLDAVGHIFTNLVASPLHLRNMSDGEFTMVGIGSVTDSAGRMWTTHVFFRPGTAVASPAALAPRPAAASSATRAPAIKAPPKPAPASATAAATVAPTTTSVAPTTTALAPVPATAAPAPTVAAATVAAALPAELPVVPVSSTSNQGAPGWLVTLTALFALLLLGAAGLLVRRSASTA